MEGLNQCNFIGHIGQEPTLNYTQGGDAVMNFRIACGKRIKNRQTGEFDERTEWVPIVVWGKRAEGLSKFLTQGSRVSVVGEFTTRSWEKEGQKRYTSEIRASNIIILSVKGRQVEAQPNVEDDQPHESDQS